MESPVVIDKPPEYHGNNERGFPFDEEEASGAWSDLAARHPDIAARLRQRPSGWTSKRRPSSQDASDDFDDFGGRFPFDDIPAEFREHFPTHWNRRFQREEQPQAAAQQQQAQQSAPASPQQQSSGTQTEPPPEESESSAQSAADAERAPRCMSAPPAPAPPAAGMSRSPPAPAAPASVRHIPIFVEGRDEPVLPRPDQQQTQPPQHPQQTFPPPPQQTFVPPPPPGSDNDYFDDDFFPPRNVARAFGVPFGSKYRQGPQPFTQAKAYPQAASARAASPRAPSPHGDEFVRVPVHHEHRPEAPSKQQQQQRPPQQQQQQQQRPPQQQQQQQRQAPPQQQHPQQQQHQPSPPPQKPASNDPITLILSIQTDVLNLMSEVENFTGSKKDKQYMFLDEMLTRNLIKLDNIETDGKENIRQARKEAIRCIQKCIAVLEAKAEKNSAARAAAAAAATTDAEMKETAAVGDTEIKEAKEISEPQAEAPPAEQAAQPPAPADLPAPAPADLPAPAQPPPPDTRPDADKPDDQKENLENKPQDNVQNKTPKKGKVVKKRDKSKDTTASSSKQENVENSQLQVDNKDVSQKMEVDGAASQ